MLYAGIDAGSRTVKVVFLNARGKAILAQGLVDQGVHQEALARHLFDRLLREKKLDQSRIRKVVATGYGRNQIGFAHATVTEITCQAAGVRFRRPRARTIVDIGGQDSKFIQLDADGSVRDFAMNDRCAAGTGRFLEVTAGRLGMDLSALGEVAQTSRDPARISSMCVVFAETEIVGLLAAGVKPSDIAAGVQRSIAQRIAGMAGRNIAGSVCFTGGVALVPGMVQALETALKVPVRMVPEPQLTGALGAALLARANGKRVTPAREA